MTTAVVFGTVATTLAGGYVARRFTDRRHLVLGLVAGLMLGVVGFDLLPEALHMGEELTVLGLPGPMLAFMVGFLALHVLERTAGLHTHHEDEYATHHHSKAASILAPTGMVTHSLLDGFAIGAAFQLDTAAGISVAIAVLAHDFADGFNTYSVAARGGSKRRATGFLIVGAVAPLAGAGIALAVTLPETVLSLYLGAFAGLLLYLATSDILPEAHANHPTRMTVVTTLAGVGVMGVIVALAPHAGH